MKPKLSEIYDEFAETYDENRGLFDLSKIFNTFYQQLNIDKGNLLDLGCGSGEAFSKLFIQHDWNVTGVDFSKKMVELAQQYVPEMQTIHADICKVEFANNKFDAIVAIYSLFHIPCKDHTRIFQNMHRWLRKDGKALFTYATKQYTGNEEYNGYVNFLGKDLFYSHKTPEQLHKDLEAVGFKVEHEELVEISGEIFLWITVSKHP